MKIFQSRSVIVILILLVVLSACSSKESAESEQDTFDSISDSKITAKEIAQLNFEDFVFSSEATKLVTTWTAFQEIETQVEFLKTADFTFYKSEATLIKSTFKNALDNIPESLNTNSIKARLTVLETKFLKLQNDLTLDNISKVNQLETIKDVLVSWSNLVLVINKKVEFESNDVIKPGQN